MKMNHSIKKSTKKYKQIKSMNQEIKTKDENKNKYEQENFKKTKNKNETI
jgi:hypothetical protein